MNIPNFIVTTTGVRGQQYGQENCAEQMYGPSVSALVGWLMDGDWWLIHDANVGCGVRLVG